MTDLRTRLGSLIVCGFQGKILPTQFQNHLQSGSLGGIILFARNYDDSSKLRKLTGSIASAAQREAIIAVDQEGGRVVRFDGDFPTFPSPLHYGERNDETGFLNAIDITAIALVEHGVNLNLIPVSDLSPADKSHVLHSRAYSPDPESVSRIVAKQIQILKAHGMMSCAKHFPGLASATGDPHLRVSESNQSLEQFRTRDYLPFQAAIAAGVDMIMPTHVRASALDSQEIVTFSEKAISAEIRGHLGFDRVIITDDLQMLGALEGIDQVEAGRRSLLAGCDLLIYADLNDSLDMVIDGLAECASHEEALSSRIEQSYHRIVRLLDSRARMKSA